MKDIFLKVLEYKHKDKAILVLIKYSRLQTKWLWNLVRLKVLLFFTRNKTIRREQYLLVLWHKVWDQEISELLMEQEGVQLLNRVALLVVKLKLQTVGMEVLQYLDPIKSSKVSFPSEVRKDN